MGKTLADADGEVGRGIESVESAAAIPHLLKGETLEGVAAGVDVEMVRQPVGVVAAITPFNFPAMIPLWFLPYAIACGNTLHPQALRAGPAAGGADRRDRRLDRARSRPASSTSSTAAATRSPRSSRTPSIDAVSFVGRAETARIIAQGGAASRQAGAGARRGEELAGRDARRRSRAGDAGDHGLGLRRRRPALPGGLGLRRRRRRGSAGPRSARRWSPPPRQLNVGAGRRPGDRRLPDGLGRRPRAGRRRRSSRGRGRGRRAPARRPRRRRAGRDAAGPDDRRRRRPRVRAGPRGAVRAAADRGRASRPRRRARVPQRLALRQRRRDLHPLGRGRPPLPLRRRGRDARRQRRRPRAGRLVPVLGLEGLDATATCTPTAPTRSTSTPARRSSPAAGRRAGQPPRTPDRNERVRRTGTSAFVFTGLSASKDERAHSVALFVMGAFAFTGAERQ